jgi:hypothetical protein
MAENTEYWGFRIFSAASAFSAALCVSFSSFFFRLFFVVFPSSW